MALFCSSASVGTRTNASASRLPWTKRSNFKQSALGIEPVGLYSFVALIEFLRTDHVTVNPLRGELPLQSKTKPARFINRMHFTARLAQLGCPMQEDLFLKTLRRLGISPLHLLHHDIKVLMHINPKLDRASAAIKLATGFLE